MKIIIVGGGTGGHLFPGIAIAREFQKRNPKIKILFVGTRKGIEFKVLPKEKLELKTILSSGLKGKISWRTLIALVEMPIALLQSLLVLMNFRPKLVLGVGGYVTGPFDLMAWLLRIPTAIQEQNSMPGMTNRILGRIVDKIFVTFEKSKKHFPEKKIEVTGNPIREEYYEAKVRRKESQFNVLIFGGSKGASSINRAMVEALDFLSEDKNSLHFIHQTGEEQFKTVKKSYRSKNVSADVSKFIFNMADDYRRSNLVICRAGASTLAEIAACGRAAILVPYPFAANNHQQLNAEYLVEQGAALMVKDCDLSGKKIAELIKKMMHQPNLLQEIEKVSAAMAKKDAGKKVVDLCYELIA
ncbi:MAG: undecaprenyldiphospho-muramoylpentapeptide beta-N-acetylglucosaminyltransferase [Nitrospinota bacterium]|nr:undecaprenyldiphospho-muramoylpentapeptide beta-N-acetylglucosaminyltransferase [Nitrospinota bacterium]